MLRPYQQDLLADMSVKFRAGHRAVLGQLPTGGGKTHIAIEATRRAAERGKRVLFQAHTRVLVEQTSARFREAGLDHGVIMAGRSQNGLPIQVGSIQSLARRLGKIEPFDLIITDECHRATSGSYARVLQAWPNAYHIGFSATPHRLDGKGLGKVFEALVCGPSVGELIDQGHLAPFRVFAPSQPDLGDVKTVHGDYEERGLAEAMDRSTITGDAVDHYRRLAPDRQAIAYCCSIRHAEHVAEQFRAAGVSATVLHSKISAQEQAAAVAGLRDGSLRVLVSVGMVSEGFDVPAVTCAILLRPTKSLVLACQQWGRANRGGGAEPALVLDHAGNVLRHGLPDQAREWSLHGRPERQSKSAAKIAIRLCRTCFAVYPPHLDRCPHCGGTAEATGRKLAERDGELIEVTPEMEREGLFRCIPLAEALAQCADAADIRVLAKVRGYKPTWAIIKTVHRFEVSKWRAAEMLGYQRGLAARVPDEALRRAS